MIKNLTTKLSWVLSGAIIGSIVSLSFDKLIIPHLSAKPELRFHIQKESENTATFKIINIGDKVATNIQITIFATAPTSAERPNITNVNHNGGVVDSSCTFGTYTASLMGPGKSIAESMYSKKSQAVFIDCDQINSRDNWKGRVEYDNAKVVNGLMAHIRYSEKTTIIWRKFDVKYSD